MPLSCLHYSTPYEKLYNKPASVDHLKVFGCPAYASTIKANRSKFDARVVPCVFLGYPIGQKAYKLLNLETHKVFISRDVTFHEKHLPYHLSASSQPHCTPLFLPASTILDTSISIAIPDVFHSFIDPVTPASSPTTSTCSPSIFSSHTHPHHLPFLLLLLLPSTILLLLLI